MIIRVVWEFCFEKIVILVVGCNIYFVRYLEEFKIKCNKGGFKSVICFLFGEELF